MNENFQIIDKAIRREFEKLREKREFIQSELWILQFIMPALDSVLDTKFIMPRRNSVDLQIICLKEPELLLELTVLNILSEIAQNKNIVFGGKRGLESLYRMSAHFEDMLNLLARIEVAETNLFDFRLAVYQSALQAIKEHRDDLVSDLSSVLSTDVIS